MLEISFGHITTAGTRQICFYFGSNTAFFAHLPQGVKHRLAPTHAELAKTLEEVRLPAGITLIQYVDIEWGQ